MHLFYLALVFLILLFLSFRGISFIKYLFRFTPFLFLIAFSNIFLMSVFGVFLIVIFNTISIRRTVLSLNVHLINKLYLIFLCIFLDRLNWKKLFRFFYLRLIGLVYLFQWRDRRLELIVIYLHFFISAKLINHSKRLHFTNSSS